jgi:TPR repeat protein
MKLSLAEITSVVETDPENELARNRKDALLAKEATDPSEKIKHLQAAVDRGCPAAQLILGTIYQTRDEPELALPLFKKSAAAGLATAQLMLSLLLNLGAGTNVKELDKDDVRDSFKMMIRSATAGDADSQAIVAMTLHAHSGSFGIKKNDVKAFHYASLASAQGSDIGRHRLGLLLKDGVGCEKNEKMAIDVLTQAVESGYTLAMISLGLLHLDMGCVDGQPDGELSPDQVPHFEQACRWLEKATEQSKICF